MCVVAILAVIAAASIAGGADIISNGPVSTLGGRQAINPRLGTQGGGGQFNSLFYVVPGEGEAAESGRPSRHKLPDQPFFVAYENNARPVQSSDWWTGVGLQWAGHDGLDLRRAYLDLTQEERQLVRQVHDFFEERLRIRVI